MFFDSEIADVAALAPGTSFMTVPTGFDLPNDRWIGGGGYLAWVGRVDPFHKGLDVLVGAIARLPRDQRPRLRIHGYDYRGGIARLRHVIEKRGLQEWVSIEGAIAGADKTRFLQQADGYAHPSRWESHSIALLESLALGIPCVVSNVIHIARTLAQSSAAVLAQPSETGLAAALSRLAADRREVAPRGRALVNDAFNWTSLMPQFYSAIGRLGLQ
jgi:glycosyltransferase involved in cell wall biosynthesis